MLPAAGGEVSPGPNLPPGAGRYRKLAPPSVVVTMAGQSRVPQGRLPSTHQWVTLIAVNDSGTNSGGAEGREGAADAGPAGAAVAERGGDDDVVVAGPDAAGRAAWPQPASRPAASNAAARRPIPFRMTSETSPRPVPLRARRMAFLALPAAFPRPARRPLRARPLRRPRSAGPAALPGLGLLSDRRGLFRRLKSLRFLFLLL